MKTSIPKWLFITIGLFSFYSCTKVIELDLSNVASNIVIEAVITNTSGPYQVLISKTVNFTASNDFPPVSAATVTITDVTSSVTDILTETTPGTYVTNAIEGIPGHSYRLSVIAEGQTYTASSTMVMPVVLDSLTFQSLNIFGSAQINAIAHFQDPAGTNNWYSFSQVVSGRKLKEISVFDDRLSNGLYINEQIFSDSAYIRLGDTVSLQMNCIDKNVWNYLNTLGPVAGGDNFDSGAPSNPIGNISNRALGYFSAQTIQTKIAVPY